MFEIFKIYVWFILVLMFWAVIVFAAAVAFYVVGYKLYLKFICWNRKRNAKESNPSN